MVVRHMALASGHRTKSGLLVYGMNMRRNQNTDDLETWTRGLANGIDLLFSLPTDDERIIMATGLAEGTIQGQMGDLSFAQDEYHKNREKNWYHPLNQIVMALFERKLVVL